MSKNKKRKIKNKFITAAVFIAAVLLFVGLLLTWKTEKTPEAPKIPETPRARRTIDGVWVEPGQENPSLAGVMIENMIEAQPISGIADARLVFEALTEANITRFLAYFVLPSSPSPNPLPGGEGVPTAVGVGESSIEIGPVRSARPYYLDWAAEFNTIFAHVGSSPAAYELLRKKGVEGVNDLDQWYKSEYFFLKQGRQRPHHIYTTTELLRKAYDYVIGKQKTEDREQNNSVRLPSSVFSPLLFKNDGSPDLRGDVDDIKIGYVAPYNVEWLYDKSENHYKRIQWARPTFVIDKSSVGQGGTHKDAQGKEIIAKNIAVAFMKMKVLDEVGRKEFTTIGEGKGLVFQDGRVVVGTWKKASARERLRWYDSQGKEVEFNAGITWVEIAPEEWKVGY